VEPGAKTFDLLDQAMAILYRFLVGDDVADTQASSSRLCSCIRVYEGLATFEHDWWECGVFFCFVLMSVDQSL
jgi:hypothetical protein